MGDYRKNRGSLPTKAVGETVRMKCPALGANGRAAMPSRWVWSHRPAKPLGELFGLLPGRRRGGGSKRAEVTQQGL